MRWQRTRRADRWADRGSGRRHRRWAVAAALFNLALLVAALLTVGLRWGPARAQVLASTTRRPTPYTELFFSDFHALPVVAQAGQSYPFAFVVVNHTGHFEDYVVTTRVTAGSRSAVLGKMTVGVADGGRAERTVAFAPAPHNRYVVTISLGNGEAIHWAVIAP